MTAEAHMPGVQSHPATVPAITIAVVHTPAAQSNPAAVRAIMTAVVHTPAVPKNPVTVRAITTAMARTPAQRTIDSLLLFSNILCCPSDHCWAAVFVCIPHKCKLKL